MTDETYIPYKELKLPELIEHFGHGNLGTIVWEQMKEDLKTGEEAVYEEDVKKLTMENMAFGGSEHGYFCDSQLFAVGSSFNTGDISPIHESLFMRADAIKQNSEELAQDSTYIGNFLSVAQGMTDNLLVFLANLPVELFKFSYALGQLENHANSLEDDWRTRYRRDRAEPEFSNFYLHFDRIEPKLKRYLFRRLTT